MDFLEHSYEMLLKMRTGKPIDPHLSWYANSTMDLLQEALDTDIKKKTFWINIYNSIFQYLAKEKKLSHPHIYKNKSFEIGNKTFSLDDIEHGILRRFKHKYSLGYFPNPFTPKYIKTLSVDLVDYRIHFALNCGAKSCPPIAFYTSNKLDHQLDIATSSFLEEETIVDHKNQVVSITKLCLWFKKDFGGRKGIRRMLFEHLQLKLPTYSIRYLPYSWESRLDHYV